MSSAGWEYLLSLPRKRKPKTSEGWVHSELGEGRKPQKKFSKMLGLTFSSLMKPNIAGTWKCFPSSCPIFQHKRTMGEGGTGYQGTCVKTTI